MNPILCGILAFLALNLSSTNAMYTGPFSSSKWTEAPAQLTATQKSATHTFKVALKLRDVERMHQHLMEVSDPNNSNYGKYLSDREVHALYGPEKHTKESVIQFFRSMSGATVKIADHGDIMTVTAPIESIESTLKTKMGVVVDKKGENVRALRATQSLTFPSNIADAIAYTSLNGPVVRMKRHGVRDGELTAASAAIAVTGGNNDALIRFPSPVCDDGTYNHHPTPCPDEGAMISFRVELNTFNNDKSNPYQLNVAPKVYEVDSERVYCYNSDNAAECQPVGQNNDDSTSCVCLLRLTDLPKYTQLKTTVKTIGQTTGEVTDLGTSDMFALTDVATMPFLQNLYKIPAADILYGSNQSVAEFYGQYYSNTDLSTFLKLSGLEDASLPVENIYGDDKGIDEGNAGGEAQLDIEYLMGMAPKAPTFFYSMSKLNPNEPVDTNEDFLDYLQTIEGQAYPPLVHSMSYGDLESDIFNPNDAAATDYGVRCDQEFAQAGLRGLTFIFSSGDDGSPSSIIREDVELACSQAWPNWPASSPYVTTVGATQMTNNYLPACGKPYSVSAAYGPVPDENQLLFECTGTGETVCSGSFGGVITSGGGFSNFYDRNEYAPWQVDFVEKYLADSSKIPSADFFNSTGRAYPDVSTYGSNYFVYINGAVTRESGTSASAPVLAAMVTHWNDLRLKYNMPPMGFLAPFLYSASITNKYAFNDITTGDIACGVGSSLDTIPCCDQTFKAASGWDAASGLGSPNFEIISSLVLNKDSPFAFMGAYPMAGATEASTKSEAHSAANDADDALDKAELAFDIGIAGLVLAAIATVLAIVLNRVQSKGQRLLEV